MENKDRIMFGLTFFGLCFSMFSLGLNAFTMAGFKPSFLTLYTLGLVAYLSMFIYFIMGAIIIIRTFS